MKTIPDNFIHEKTTSRQNKFPDPKLASFNTHKWKISSSTPSAKHHILIPPLQSLFKTEIIFRKKNKKKIQCIVVYYTMSQMHKTYTTHNDD